MSARNRGWRANCPGHTIFPSLLAGLLLGGCAQAISAKKEAVSADALRIEDSAFSLLQSGSVVRTLTTVAPIEALGSDGDLVIWQSDDDSGDLYVLAVKEDPTNVQTIAAGLEVDAICVGQLEGRVYDLFLSDGEGSLHHYWLDLSGVPTVRLVRTLATNPGVVSCDVDAERVYFVNPPIGVVSYSRSPETDPIMALVHASGPGPQDITGVRLVRSQGRPALHFWNKGGEGYEIDIEDPQHTTRSVLLSPVIPLDANLRAWRPSRLPSVMASAQTEAVPSSGDAADDPAILVGEGGTVWVVGTNKRLGLHVYSLDGRELHRIERGRLNNVDAHALSGSRYLVAASNRTHHTLDLFKADMNADQIQFASAVPLDLDDPYGLCMGERSDGALVVFVGGTDGQYQAWTIETKTLEARLLHELRFDSQTEGCVFDAVSNRVFVGEESKGIWSVDLGTWEKVLFDGVSRERLVADVEGMDIYRQGGDTWLVVSSQGDDTFLLYDLASEKQPIKFRIGPNYSLGIDGVSETDGLAVSSAPGVGFPNGMLVVQDGRNHAPSAPQNFKLVDWRQIMALSSEPKP